VGGVERAVALAPALGLGHGPAGLGGQVGGPVLGLLGRADAIDGLLPVRMAAVEEVAGPDEGRDGEEGDDGRTGAGVALRHDGEDEDGQQGDPDRDGDPAEDPHSPILAVRGAASGPDGRGGSSCAWGYGLTAPKRRTRCWYSITAW
jgi:hypothetical protein